MEGGDMTGDAALDLGALFTFSYGLYIISSRSGERVNGQISNAVMQVGRTPQTAPTYRG